MVATRKEKSSRIRGTFEDVAGIKSGLAEDLSECGEARNVLNRGELNVFLSHGELAKEIAKGPVVVSIKPHAGDVFEVVIVERGVDQEMLDCGRGKIAEIREEFDQSGYGCRLLDQAEVVGNLSEEIKAMVDQGGVVEVSRFEEGKYWVSVRRRELAGEYKVLFVRAKSLIEGAVKRATWKGEEYGQQGAFEVLGPRVWEMWWQLTHEQRQDLKGKFDPAYLTVTGHNVV